MSGHFHRSHQGNLIDGATNLCTYRCTLSRTAEVVPAPEVSVAFCLGVKNNGGEILSIIYQDKESQV